MKNKIKIIGIVCLFLLSSNVKALTLDDSNSKTFKRTKEEVILKYKQSKPNKSVETYSVTPNIEELKEGELSLEMQEETLKQLNYLRWQYGIDSIVVNEDLNYRNQKCAMIMAKLGFITHYPKDYASKLTDVPVEFLEDAAKGCGAGYGYRGNVGFNSAGQMFDAPIGYVSDRYNLMAGVGHRQSMLDVKATGISMGYYNTYDSISVYVNSNKNTEDYDYYSWPNAGYAPIENLDPKEPWSIYLNPKKYGFTSSTKVSLNYLDTNYEVSYNKESYDNAISFLLPDALLEQVVNSSSKYKDDTEIKVQVKNITNGREMVEINYTVKLIIAELIDYNDLIFWYKDVNSNGWGRSRIYVNSTWHYNFDGSKKYNLRFDLDNQNANNVGDFEISLENSSIGTYEDKVLTFLRNGTTNIVVLDTKTKKEFKFPIYVSNVIEKEEYDVTITPKNLTYNGEYQSVATVDSSEFVEIYFALKDESKPESSLSYITNIPKARDAGTYTLYYYIKEDDTHYEKRGNMTIVVNKAIRPELTIESFKGLYDGNSHTIGVNQNNVLYSTDKINWQTEAPTLTTIGELTIYVKYQDDNNYQESSIKEGKIIIRDPNEIIKGDLNFDKVIDIIDVKLLLLETFEEHNESDFDLMDINDDKTIDIIDVKQLLLNTFD